LAWNTSHRLLGLDKLDHAVAAPGRSSQDWICFIEGAIFAGEKFTLGRQLCQVEMILLRFNGQLIRSLVAKSIEEFTYPGKPGDIIEGF